MNSFILDPEARLDYVFDWSAWLTEGETISEATVLASPAGLTVAPPGSPTVVTGTTVTVWLTGGVVGARYDVTCRVTTSAGRVDDRSIRIRSAHR